MASLPRICVYGAGAVGGHVAARLAHAGLSEVSVVARGPHLQAIRRDGLTLRHLGGGVWNAHPARASDDPADLPPQDIVLVGLKAPALPQHAKALDRLLAPGGYAVFMVNGIPWWWRHGLPGQAGAPLELLDPQGALWRILGPERTLGAVIHSANEIEQPGLILNRGDNRFILGEPDGSDSRRLADCLDLMRRSGLATETAKDLRLEIWRKLLLNVAGGPVCALTRLDHAARSADGDLNALGVRLAGEFAAIAAAMGLAPGEDYARRAAHPPRSGRPSMLQDVLLSRTLEVEAQLGQPQRFARERNVATPCLDIVLPLLRGLNRANNAEGKSQ